MKLSPGFQLAYCTNIHRGEDWATTFDALQRHTLAVRKQVCPDKPYAIGLRLGEAAARELSDPETLRTFRQWLERNQCYVFTINGFPYGQFHGTRVKEHVYLPDWTAPERLAYTNRLFDLLAELLPPGMEGSVSTVPGSFKAFVNSEAQVKAMRDNLWRCVEHLDALARRTGKMLHLGLEPEPLCYLETSAEAAAFFDQLRADRPGDDRIARHLGVNYDCCHLAVEFESAKEALNTLREHQVRLSKIHLSSALRAVPRGETRRALAAFADATYFHQVVERRADGSLVRYRDLDEALARAEVRWPVDSPPESVEWRIHFHVPLHSPPTNLFGNTADHLQDVLDDLQEHPELCSHFEMETYTWEVMPAELKQRHVVDQLVGEYDWTLRQFARRGFVPL